MTPRPAPQWLADAVRELQRIARKRDRDRCILTVRTLGTAEVWTIGGLVDLRIDAAGAVTVESDASGMLGEETQCDR